MPRYENLCPRGPRSGIATPAEEGGFLLSPADAGRRRGVRTRSSHRPLGRDEAIPTASAVFLTVRQKLAEFFAAVERGAEDAEAAFRDRVEAILIGPADPDVTDGGPRPGPSPAGRQCVVPPDD